MKKHLALILALCMIFALCACDALPPAPTPTPVPTPSPTPAPTPAPVDNTAEDSQIALIFNNLSILSSDAAGSPRLYAITDLDHNGRIELVAAVTEGTGQYTSGRIIEIDEAYSAFREVNLGLAAREYLPDVITSPVDTYYDAASDTYYYIYTDTNPDANAAHYDVLEALSLKNGILSHTVLGWRNLQTINGRQAFSCYDANGGMLDPTSYSALASTRFANCEKSSSNLQFFQLSGATLDTLISSYKAFVGRELRTSSGTPAVPSQAYPAATPAQAFPTVTPMPTRTPTPTPTPVIVRAPSVTKSPTGETVVEGGDCYFIARANDYTYLTWQFIDPYGNVYPNCPFNNMNAIGMNQETLHLTNIPVDANGWSVRAAFTGTSTVYSDTAKLTVKPNIQISAYPANNTRFSDYYNSVSLFAGSSDQIHYELYKEGDTGPYKTGTVNSGGSVSVEGIYDLDIAVTLYACVVGDEDNRLENTYYVDLRQPEPEPVLHSCSASITYADSDTFTVRISGASITLSKALLSNSIPYGSFDPWIECTVYYYGSEPSDAYNIDHIVAQWVY